MAKESSESVKTETANKKSEAPAAVDETAAIRSEIERTRGDMAKAVNQIEERLSPAHIKEQIASVAAGVTSDIEKKVTELKESVVGGYHETKDHLKEDLGRELKDARHLVSDEFTHARAAVREATVGRVEHMVHDARESVTETGTTILDTIKANPIPAALVGLGLGWLIFSARASSARTGARSSRSFRGGQRSSLYGANGDRYAYGAAGYVDDHDSGDFTDMPRRALRQGQRAIGDAVHAASEGASNLGHRVQEGASNLAQGAQGAAHDASDAVTHFAHDATHRVADVAGGARDAAMQFAGGARDRGQQVVRGAGRQFMRAERGAETMLRENPLAVGAVALAIGAAIGMSLPSTIVEDEWMGDAKDRLFHQAEEYAGDAIHKAEEAVGQLTAGGEGGQGGDDAGKKDGGRQDSKQGKKTESANYG